MNNFIEVTKTDGLKTFINFNKVKYLKPGTKPGTTIIGLSATQSITVNEPYESLKTRILCNSAIYQVR